MSQIMSQPFQKPVNWRLVIVLLLISSVFGSVGAVYVPLLPLYALSELGASMEIATAAVMSFPMILTLIIVFPLSMYADRSGRRVEVLVAGTVVGILSHLLLLIKSLPIFIAARVIAGIAFATGPVMTFIIASIVPPKLLGTMLALTTGTMVLASGVFQIFAGSIYSALGGYPPLFYLAAICGFIALLIALPAYIMVLPVARTKLPGIRFSDIVAVLKTKAIYWVGISICIYLIGWNLMYPSLSIVVTQIYKAPTEIATAIFGAASLMLGLGTYIWGPVIDRWGARRTLVFAIIASAITTFIMYFLLGSLWGYAVFFMLLTVFGVVGAPGTSYVAIRSTRPELVSVAVSVPWIFTYLATIIGGFLSGALLASVGLGMTILIAAIIELIGGIMMLGLPKGL